MTGFQFYRMVKGLQTKELAQLTGISCPTLKHYEDQLYQGDASRLLKLSDTLNVPIDELLRTDLPDAIEGRISIARRERGGNQNNCITVYRDMKRLSLTDLAKRLAIRAKNGREGARKACLPLNPSEKKVAILAAYEGMTVEQFKETYRPAALQ
jgi:DNA-binding XRE family transcriptional regulator